MLALVESTHVLTTTLAEEDVGGRDKPDHDAKGLSRKPFAVQAA